LFELAKYGQGVCLSRLSLLLDTLGINRQQLSAKSVVVCGSNGKGSCAAICESIGRNMQKTPGVGLKTGLFTSPHLLHFSERFQIDRLPISDADLQIYMARVMAGIQACDPFTSQFGAFEAQFALACLYFQESDCDLLIFEAGIGGRYDPVRLVQSPFVAVTSLDLEHTALLGNSLELIGFDKSDACPPQGTVFYGPNCAALMAELTTYNKLRNVKTVAIARHPLAHHQRLIGQFQQDNGSVAIALMQAWAKQAQRATVDSRAIDSTFESTIDSTFDAAIENAFDSAFETAAIRGLQTVQWNGRMQKISDQPLVIIDVGHTPDGIRAALQALDDYYPNYDWLCVTGVSSDKDATGILQLLIQRFDQFICTQAHHKGAEAVSIVNQLKALSVASGRKLSLCELQTSIADAVKAVRVHAKQNVDSTTGVNVTSKPSKKLAIFVAGGLFLATEFAEAWQGRDPRALQFF
jgi:dihydrofolate synthase / folylpolyglutamate synthase